MQFVTLLYTRKLDTSCQAMRQEVMPAKFQPHASQMHLKWAEIRCCTQYAVYSNELLLLLASFLSIGLTASVDTMSEQ